MSNETRILESFAQDGLNPENLVTADVIGALEKAPSDMEDEDGE